MRNLKRIHIELKETIDERDYKLINDLQNICTEKDNISMKLELDYKVKTNPSNKIRDWSINEFMYFYDNNLIGYIGICSFGELGTPLEVTGMVHPQYRRNGFGREILMTCIEKLNEENADKIILQVETKNSNALNLYKSCGFEESSIMDYYEFKNEIGI